MAYCHGLRLLTRLSRKTRALLMTLILKRHAFDGRISRGGKLRASDPLGGSKASGWRLL